MGGAREVGGGAERPGGRARTESDSGDSGTTTSVGADRTTAAVPTKCGSVVTGPTRTGLHRGRAADAHRRAASRATPHDAPQRVPRTWHSVPPARGPRAKQT